MITKLSSSRNNASGVPCFNGKGQVTKKVMFKFTDVMLDNFEKSKKKFTEIVADEFSRSSEDIESFFDPKKVEQLNRDFAGFQQIYKAFASLRKSKMAAKPGVEKEWNPILNKNYKDELVEFLQRNKIIDKEFSFQNLPAKFIALSKGDNFIDEDLAKQANRVVVNRGVVLDSPIFKNVTLKNFKGKNVSIVAENANIIKSTFKDAFIEDSVSIQGAKGKHLIANNTVYSFGDDNNIQTVNANDVILKK